MNNIERFFAEHSRRENADPLLTALEHGDMDEIKKLIVEVWNGENTMFAIGTAVYRASVAYADSCCDDWDKEDEEGQTAAEDLAELNNDMGRHK